MKGSPVGVVELLDQLPAVSQTDLDVGCGLGGVEVYRGAGLSLDGSLVLLGQGRNCDQFWSGAGRRSKKKKKKNQGHRKDTSFLLPD